ncbi:hypothetical protein [Pantoea agglomerans]|uniref:hypothetical protein n=1 Tax=Enterobacter agglomerans TaxID=549 RepID=UPI0037C6EB90
MTIGLSPGDTALNLILQFADSAHQSMDVADWDFTSQSVVEALSASVARDVVECLVADEGKDGTAFTSQCAGLRGVSAGPAFYLFH